MTSICIICGLHWGSETNNSLIRSRLSKKVKLYRVGIKPGFYHKAQPSGFYRFYEGGLWGFYGFYVGFINLNVYY